ncbi:MAG: hypothetical protein K0R50_233 [Eubacterium sp.]|jgi:hypothetical protein|nr:hypothetical protein [Eubacterium sp.]
MPSENKTANYELNRWQGNEYPKREDFNSDNAIIDTELKNVNDKAESKISRSLATAANQFLLSSAVGQWAVKTVAEIKTLLGIKSAAEKEFNTAGGVAAYDTVQSHVSDYVRQPGYAITTGSANTYVATLNPAPATFGEGLGIVLKIHAANTGASTLNVNGLGAKPIIDGKGNAIKAGKLLYGRIYSLKYDGANFQLQGEGGDIPKLPNLIKNGNFRFDTNAWNFNSATGSVSNNVLTFTSSTTYGQVYQSIKQPLVDDKVYMRCELKGALSSRFILYFAPDNGFVISPTIANTWKTLSYVAQYPSIGSLASIAFDDSAPSGWMPIQVKNVIFFNLTQIFGVGNEPTKEEIDAMIDEGVNKFCSSGLYKKQGINAFSRSNENTFWVRCDTGATYAFVDYLLSLKPNSTYRLKAATNGTTSSAGTISVFSRDYSVQYGYGAPGNINYTFTTPSDGMVSVVFYANVNSSSSSNPEAAFTNVSITEGSSDLPFTPYKPTGWQDNDISSLIFDSTALTGDVIAGKVFYGADGYRAIGTIANYANTMQSAEIVETNPITAGGLIMLHPKPGYYNTAGNISAYDPNFIPANIVSGKSIFGLPGTNTNKRWANGQVTTSSSQLSFIREDGTPLPRYYISLTGLSFVPRLIIVQYVQNKAITTTYYSDGFTLNSKIKVCIGLYTLTQTLEDLYRLDGISAFVNTSGFVLPVHVYGDLKWEAYE